MGLLKVSFLNFLNSLPGLCSLAIRSESGRLRLYPLSSSCTGKLSDHFEASSVKPVASTHRSSQEPGRVSRSPLFLPSSQGGLSGTCFLTLAFRFLLLCRERPLVPTAPLYWACSTQEKASRVLQRAFLPVAEAARVATAPSPLLQILPAVCCSIRPCPYG